MTDLKIHASRRRKPGISRIFGRLTESVRKRRQIRREIIALSNMPDYLLRDIGLHDRVGWRKNDLRDKARRRTDPDWRHSF